MYDLLSILKRHLPDGIKRHILLKRYIPEKKKWKNLIKTNGHGAAGVSENESALQLPYV